MCLRGVFGAGSLILPLKRKDADTTLKYKKYKCSTEKDWGADVRIYVFLLSKNKTLRDLWSNCLDVAKKMLLNMKMGGGVTHSQKEKGTIVLFAHD